MAYSSIRSALKTRLQAVTGLENVHEFHHYIANGLADTAFTTLFAGAAGNLHCWRFTRTSASLVQCPDSDGVVKKTHSIEVQAYFSLRDGTATENTFQDLVETVLANFISGDHTLGGVCITYSLPQLTRFGAAMFHDVLCHEAVINLTVEENV